MSLPHAGQRGVALVVTLILLVVITTLAVAFLALSHRETTAVSGSGNTLVAEYATDAGQNLAVSQIIGQIASRNANGAPNDLMGPDYMVSVCAWTNRRPSTKFPDGSLGLITNPSVPVLIWTNKALNNPSAVEDRFFVDLNRNGRFEESGYVMELDDAGNPILDANSRPIFRWRMGDPQWIGLLRDPNRQHGPDNPFIARYAYMIVPAGRSLDINWIHNQAIKAGSQTYDSYYRNQGIGPWEMNLAAFLADVNPRYWNTNTFPSSVPYSYTLRYSTVLAEIRGQGDAFADARELLYCRFPRLQFNDWSQFGTCSAYFGPLSLNTFPYDAIDLYCNGPVAPFGGSALTASLYVKDNDEQPNVYWVGSRSDSSFFTIHDLWDVPLKTLGGGVVQGNDPVAGNRNLPGFLRRLKHASARGNTEDRYTYYRIVAQLGTDSPPERDDRLNINYRNVTNDYATPIGSWPTNYSRSGLATNIEPWAATNFFHTAVDRLLTNEFFPYGITNVRLSGVAGGAGIPVYTNGSVFINGNSNLPPIYSPRIQQLLQMTLNIYEATTNDTSPNNLMTTNLPTVLRPIFERQPNGDIYITGYKDETGRDMRSEIAGAGARLRWYELGDPAAPIGQKGSPNPDVNFYDIPILFGARKGLPNFNEFTMNTVSHFSRKVQVERDATLRNVVATNQMLIMSISNSFVCEFWNSYSNFPPPKLAYPRPLEFIVGVASASLLGNGSTYQGASFATNGDAFAYGPSTWSNAYRLTQVMTNAVLSPAIFYSYPPNGPGFKLFDQNTSANNAFERVGPATTNRWALSVSNRVRCFLFDNGRLIDCYASARMNSFIDLSKELDAAANGSAFDAKMWDPVRGVGNQIDISSNYRDNGTDWIDFSGLAGFSTIDAQTKAFGAFANPDIHSATQRVMQAGYSPNVRILQVSSWEANDPLVHYTVYDLYGGAPGGNVVSNTGIARVTPRVEFTIFTNVVADEGISSPGYSLGNRRYSPWGGIKPDPSFPDPSKFRFAEKDPGVYESAWWDFPLQKFPSLGWLGRVHRGTPWQTIYLKAPDPNYTMEHWAAHMGAAYMPDTFPTNDWRLLDVFTAAIHPNATRGRLSINQTNPAAWSAVFASVPVSAALDDGSGWPPLYETNVQPSAVDTPLASIVESINGTRASMFGGQFRKLSEFMMVTNLTVGSPYFANINPDIKQSVQFSLVDSDYERLPQQILSLVKVGEPRYVVYAWGQSLKPADYVPGIGIGIDAGTKLTRNYQITGELATRAVVRVEFERNQVGQSLFNRPHAVVENFNILPNE